MADNLTAFSWLSLIVFAIVIFFCIHPLRVPIPFTHGRFGVSHIWLDIATAPIVGILVLLATTSINGLVLRDGIVGSEHGIQPYSVVLLIFALAYICISIDVTGFFEYVAFQVTKRGGSSGHRLFLYLFLLSTIMTIFTSNDVVVLTITPIVCYLTQETKTDPKAYLVSTFIVCNIASLALYIGNPTNIIVAQAFRINFIQYSAWMGLPTLLAVGLAYLMCFVVLRSHIPVNIPSPPPEAEERYQIRDRWGAFIGCAVLLACLLGLMIVPIFADVPVWMLTLPFGAIMIGKDMIMDLTRNCRPQKTEHENIELGSGGTSEVRMLRRESSNEQNVSLSSESVENKECLIESKDASAEDNISVEMNGTHSGPTNSVRTERNSVASASSRVPAPSRSRLGSRQGSSLAEVESCDGSDLLVEETRKKSSIVSRMSAWSNALPTVYHVTVRLPWKLIPFALGMFILCESLAANGWTSLLAKGMAHLSVGGHMIPMVFFTGLVTTVACSVLNNLPMTILFARVFSHPDFDATMLSIIGSSEADSARVVYALRRGGMFALIIGSNFGGNLTYLGALAGLMWDDLLRKRGMGIKQTQFFIWCIIIMPVVLFGALAVLVAEFAVEGYYM